MSYLNALRGRRVSPIAVYHKFRTIQYTDKYMFYAVFEGEEDEEFYRSYLEGELSGSNYLPLICQGKGGVLGFCDRISNSPKRNVVFFFVDTDHDIYLGLDEYPVNTFNTCGYSIESYVYEESIVREVVKRNFSVSAGDPLLEDIMDSFRRDREVFEGCVAVLMLWAICLRKKDINIELKKVNFSDIFRIKVNGLEVLDYSCRDLLRKVNSKHAVTADELGEIEGVVVDHSLSKYVRGKLLLQFLTAFFNIIDERFRGREKINGFPLKKKVDFGKKSTLFHCASFVECPERLESFLANIKIECGLT